MTIWFSADTHFGHGNIIKYCNRPFLNPQERLKAEEDARGKWRVSDETIRRHDRALLEAINERVKPDDELWILGDFCWGRRDVAARYREQILCRHVYLVWGNHDDPSIGEVFSDTYYQHLLTVEGQAIWLSHYPMRSWEGSFAGSWHLYGHVHGRLGEEDAARPSMLTRDVGVDSCNYRPWSFNELCRYMEPRMLEFQKLKEAMQRGEGEKVIVV